MISITTFMRLEPRTRGTDVAAGLAARVHDPLWFLARQWQLGEFMGEDAGTPVAARLRAERSDLTRYFPDPEAIDATDARPYDPAAMPLETMVEREPVRARVDWTTRLRAEAGLEFLRRLREAGLDAAKDIYLTAYPMHPLTGDLRVLADPDTVRYADLVAGRVPDGMLLFTDLRAALRPPGGGPGAMPASPAGIDAAVRAPVESWLDWCDTLLSEPADAVVPWRRDRMEYGFAVAAPTGDDEVVLEAAGHRGGELDWYSFAERRGTGLAPAPGGGAGEPFVRTVIPTPLRYRGMPNPRWWQLEDAQIDLGRVDASAADLARMLLLEYALIYGDDFFAVPVQLPVGSICRTRSLVVTDTFGVRVRILPAERSPAGGDPGWTMFAPSVHGTDATAPSTDRPSLFVLPPVTIQRLSGRPIEEVLYLRDEMANLAWGVERRVESGTGDARDRAEEERRRAAAADSPAADHADASQLAYRLGTTVPAYWFPLVPVRLTATGGVRLRRGAMATITGAPAEPLGDLLDLGDALIYEEEVPREGVRVTRAWHHARWVDGSTHTWLARQVAVGRGEGSSGLRFDTAGPPG